MINKKIISANFFPAPLAYPVLHRSVDTDETSQIIELFFPDDYETVVPKGVILYFSGDGGNTPEPDPSPAGTAATNLGYIWAKCRYPSVNPTGITLQFLSPVHKTANQLYEVQWAIEVLKQVITYPGGIDYILAGHSRGSMDVVGWSEMSLGEFKDNHHLVKCIISNSPAGTNIEGGYLGAYNEVRGVWDHWNSSQHPTLCTNGAGDLTNLTRPILERAWIGMDNPFLQFKIVGDETYLHSWPSNHWGEWVSLIVDFHEGL